MYGPPLRDFFFDARNVYAEVASVKRAARNEAVRRTDSKDVASQCRGLGPWSDEGVRSVWDRGTDEAALCLQYTGSSSSSDEVEADEKSTLRE